MQKITRKTINKIIIIMAAIALVIAITCSAIFITAEVNHSKFEKYLDSLPYEYGKVEFSEWSSEDIFDKNDYKNINA